MAWCFGAFRLDHRAVNSDMAEFRQPRLFAQLQNLRELSGERVQVTLAEIRHGAKVRPIEADDAHEVELARAVFDIRREE